MNLNGKWLAAVAIVVLLTVRSALGEPNKPGETKPTMAVFRLDGPVLETPVDDSFPFATGMVVALRDLTARLAKARDDQNVKAVVFLVEGASLGTSQIEELRQAMAEIRAAGKDVYAHADSLSMQDYVLLSGASRISVVPTADLWLTGLYAQSPYLGGLLAKLGIRPDFLTCGDYKSAAEIFMRDGPSPEADQMQNWLLDSIYDTQVNLIAAGRGVEPDKVRQWIDGGPYTAGKAHELGLVDAVEQRQEFEAVLVERLGADVRFDHQYGAKTQPQFDLSSPFAAFSFWGELLGGKKKKVYKDSVAIVYVDGAIVLGSAAATPFGGPGTIAASSDIRQALDQAARDDTIKAVVLRINSPGGSAVASEIILDATRRVKARKPLVVSMGDVAGSGGYYVACGSHWIFADEATITGSIGVVGGKLATSGLWNKIGINWKEYGRGANASLLSSADVFTPAERARMQSWMDEIYAVFKGHVTAIRGDRLTKPIDELAGGRVYTGRQAVDLGLVDKIGTLDDAVEFAAGEAKLAAYDVRVVPEPKNFLEMLLEGPAGGQRDDKRLSLASRRLAWQHDPALYRAALPYLEKLDPRRVRAVLTALARLELLDAEGIVLVMPEIVVGQ